MKTTSRIRFCSVLALLLAPLPGCGANAEEEGQVIAMGMALQVYTDVPSNPVPAGASATGTAWDEAGSLKLALRVAGFPAGRDFGAHLHKLACDNNKAGGHYQHMAAPTMEDVNTPTYANTSNEAWLDFTTGADGSAEIDTTQSWLPRSGEAMSIVIHAMKTDANGRAGDKLACLPMNVR
jgi:superoxide dismutase, Cu-Zn family